MTGSNSRSRTRLLTPSSFSIEMASPCNLRPSERPTRCCLCPAVGTVLDLGESVPVAGCQRSGEANLDVEAPAGAGLESEIRSVGSGNGLDDGQAETAPVALTRSVGGITLERLEQTTELVGSHQGSGVGYLERGLAGVGIDCDVDVPIGMVVVQGVVDQVRHKSLDEMGVARERR
jgi:hypothetical protein